MLNTLRHMDLETQSIWDLPGILDALVLFVLLTFGLFIFLGFCLNSLFIMAFMCYDRMKTITNLYIVNLAVVHEFFLVGLLLLIGSLVATGSWPLSMLHCHVHCVFSNMFKITGSLFVCVLIADRYFFTRPQYSNMVTNPGWRTPKLATIISGVIWIFSTLAYAPFVPMATIPEKGAHNLTRVRCILWADTSEQGRLTSIVDIMNTFYPLILGFAVPILPTLMFFFLTKYQLRQEAARHEPQEVINLANLARVNNIPEEEEQQEEEVAPGWNWREERICRDEYTELVFVLVRAHLICWVPYWIVFMMPIVFPEENYKSSSYTFLLYMTGFVNICNATVNPFLYFMHSDDIRMSLRRACYFRKESVPEQV